MLVFGVGFKVIADAAEDQGAQQVAVTSGLVIGTAIRHPLRASFRDALTKLVEHGWQH
jgi:hypothetical protein